jgi:hypothetical protein
MNLSQLTNYQLFEIIQNNSLNSEIRKNANVEFDKRKISIDEINQLISRHDSLYKPDKETGLEIKLKLLLVAFPFFIFIHNIVSALMLDKKKEYKFRQYWFYLALGYLLWTVLVILFARYYLFKAYPKI